MPHTPSWSSPRNPKTAASPTASATPTSASHGEIRAIETGESDRTDNPLHNAPHTAASLLATDWPHPYTRESAAYPDPASRHHKYWPPTGRIDNVYGDKNLICTCDSVEVYANA